MKIYIAIVLALLASVAYGQEKIPGNHSCDNAEHVSGSKLAN